jgi:hypothetical protein
MEYAGNRKFKFKEVDIGLVYLAFEVTVPVAKVPRWFQNVRSEGRGAYRRVLGMIQDFQIEVYPGEWRKAFVGDWIVYDPYNGDAWITTGDFFKKEYEEIT